MIRHAGAAIAVLLAALGAGMTPVAANDNGGDDAGARARAAEVTKTVEARRVISSESGGDWCNVLVFYEFEDHPGTIEAALTYEYYGDQESASSSPPYDDVVDTYTPTRVAPAGRHRILVNAVGISESADPSQCDEDWVPAREATFAPTGSVVLTIEQEDEPKLTIELKTYAAEGGNADFNTVPPA
ncbi:MAG TPA: hypothetical protein VEV43_00935, partial [Actinomycetota bacterium]|nr:hypothetical protein [Actinomycetota bacterium]